MTEDWREAGLSSAAFHLPACSKVTVMGWSQLEIGQRDIMLGNGHDGHYCVRDYPRDGEAAGRGLVDPFCLTLRPLSTM